MMMKPERFAHVLFFGRCALCGAGEMTITRTAPDCLLLAEQGPRMIARHSLLEAIAGEAHELVDRIAPAVGSLDYELLGFRPLLLLVHQGSLERVQRVMSLARMEAGGCTIELVDAITSGRLAIASWLWEAGARCAWDDLTTWIAAFDREALLGLQRSGTADFLTSSGILPVFSVDALADAYHLRLARREQERVRRILELTRQRICGGLTLHDYIERLGMIGGVWRQQQSWDTEREHGDDDPPSPDEVDVTIGAGDGTESIVRFRSTDDVRNRVREMLEAFAERLVTTLAIEVK